MPGRSYLFTNAISGMLRARATWNSCSVCGSTPRAASIRITAASTAASTRSVSSEKSLCPGVSSRLKTTPSCSKRSTVEVTEMPRRRSSSIQSDVAARRPRRAVTDAGLADRAGVQQQLLGERRLAGVGVRDDREGPAARRLFDHPSVLHDRACRVRGHGPLSVAMALVLRGGGREVRVAMGEPPAPPVKRKMWVTRIVIGITGPPSTRTSPRSNPTVYASVPLHSTTTCSGSTPPPGPKRLPTHSNVRRSASGPRSIGPQAPNSVRLGAVVPERDVGLGVAGGDGADGRVGLAQGVGEAVHGATPTPIEAGAPVRFPSPVPQVPQKVRYGPKVAGAGSA